MVHSEQSGRVTLLLKLSMLAGWLCSAIGYFGPWLSHRTASLSLTGVDLAELTKFVPLVLDGSVPVIRQAFYAPALAVSAGIALMVGSRLLCFHWVLRLVLLPLGAFLSLQLLPPAWSRASLEAAEYTFQLVAIACLWALLAGFWVWGRVPTWLTGSGAAALALGAAALAAWQYAILRPAVSDVYHAPIPVGWGLPVCLAGLVTLASASLASALVRSRGNGERR